MFTATEFTSLLKVLIAGLVFGAGLPALFAVGVRMLADGRGKAGPDGTMSRGNPVALGAAYVLFAAIAVVIFLGVLWITKSSLEHYLGLTVF